MTPPDPSPRAAAGAATETIRLTRAAGSVAAATGASRVLGFLRDAALAWVFGTGFGADAFLAAFRIPNLFRRLLGEGSLNAAFVPVLAETLARGGRPEAQALAAAATRVLALGLAAACLAGILAAPLIVHALAPGFSGEKFELTLGLTRLMLPYLVAAGVAALWMGTLNVFGSFAAPAATPAVLNIVMIAGALGLAPIVSRPESALALTVLVGGGAQVLFLSFCLARQGVGLWRAARTTSPALLRAVRLMLPVGLGSAFYQINVLVGSLLASFLPGGSVSSLYFAERLVEFPLGVVAVAGTTAVLPSLAREAALGDRRAAASTLAYALRMTAFVTLPATAGLLLLSEPMVALLFQRGAFGAESVRLTSQAVSYYAIGLMGVAAARVVAAVFFARQESRAPLRAAVAAMAANLLMGVALMGPMASGGLALACALSAWINLVLLLGAARRTVDGLDWRAIGTSLGRSLGATLLMAASVTFWAGMGWVRQVPEAIALGANVAGGVLVYVALSWVFRSPELAALRGSLKGSRSAR